MPGRERVGDMSLVSWWGEFVGQTILRRRSELGDLSMKTIKQHRCRQRRGFSRLALVWLLGCVSLGGWLVSKSLSSSPEQDDTAAVQKTAIDNRPQYVTKNIEDIRVGDYVLAKDPGEAGPPTPHEVVALPRNWTEHVVHVAVEGGGEVEATRMHPFWVEGSGWTDAKDLKAGDKLKDDQGQPVVIRRVWIEDRTTGTYNLTVEGVHTYYVLAGDDPLLVHNATAPPWGPPPFSPPGGGNWAQNGPQRDGMPSWTAPNSNATASWDSEGHWDLDDGEGTRTRFDWRGNPLTADEAHSLDKPPMPCN